MKPTVAALYVYPVKSCRGVLVDSALMTERGLKGDREWMIVDADGRFLTQRNLPQLALINVSLHEHTLEIRAPGMGALAIPLDLRGPSTQAVVWRDTVTAHDQGDEAATWLSSYLRASVRLVRFDQETRRYCNAVYAGDSGAHTAFADAYPLLVLSEASLADLNGRLDKPLPIDRFRPNIVLAGIEAYDEDHIAEIVFGTVTVKVVKPCTRCQVTTTDQATGVVGVEPLPTLSVYRYSATLGGVTFGMNAIVTAGAGATLARGMAARSRLSF